MQTRGTGYLIDVRPGGLDLERFEAFAAEGDGALAANRPEDGVAAFQRALALWRGAPLIELSEAPFAMVARRRLGELRLAVLEKRFDAELTLGRHLDAIGELEELAAQHPFREGFRGKLMLALYRAGRQAEALETYQATRRILVDELGVEPTGALQELERAVLRQDPALALPSRSELSDQSEAWQSDAPKRSILIVPDDTGNLEQLLSVGELLTRRPPRELILTALAPTGKELSGTSALLEAERQAPLARGVPARAAAFTSKSLGADVVRLTSEQEIDLVLTDAPAELLTEGALPPDLETILREAACDVAVLVAGGGQDEAGRGTDVVVPFGGTDHDWAAVEVAAWHAASQGAALVLLGSEARPERGKRDASRLLAATSLIVQRSTGVAARPELVPPGQEAILAASQAAGLLVVGLSERWPDEGLGAVRLAVAQGARPPTLIVRSGLRPGGVAPQDGLTRYTWSLAERR